MSDKDSTIYSNVGYFVSGDAEEQDHTVWLTWKELAEEREQEIQKLQKFRQIVIDLDRNVNGRHEGDIDCGSPTGVSHGNPHFGTGDIVGFALGGRVYRMPERGKRHDPDAWGPQ